MITYSKNTCALFEHNILKSQIANVYNGLKYANAYTISAILVV